MSEFDVRIVKFSTVEIPKPTGKQVLIKIHAVSLNPVDWKSATISTLSFPRKAGVDVAGTVAELGPEAQNDWKIGDRVSAHLDLRMDHAGFAQHSIALSHVLVPIPDAVSFHDAAAVPCAGWTAYLALYHRLNIASGKNLVIAGASGGVGSFAVQLAKQKGVRIIATCSRKNFDFVKRLGADEVLDYNSENLVDRIKELCGPVGVHYWLDNVGSQSCDLALQVLAFGGHLGIVVAGPSNDVLSTNTTFYRCQSLHYVTLGGAYRSADPADAARFVQIGQDMLKMIEEGKLSTNISHLIGFDEIPKFLQLLKDGYAGNGKIVAKIVV